MTFDDIDVVGGRTKDLGLAKRQRIGLRLAGDDFAGREEVLEDSEGLACFY